MESGGSKKGRGGELSTKPLLFFTEEEGEEALRLAEKELEDHRRKNAYNGHSGGGGGEEDDPMFVRDGLKDPKLEAQRVKRLQARRKREESRASGVGKGEGDDTLEEGVIQGQPLSLAQKRAAQRAAKSEREASEAQQKLDNMSDEEYRQYYEEMALQEDSDSTIQNGKNYSLLQLEFLILSIERVSDLRPHSMLTGASSDDEVRNAWKPVAELYNLLVSGKWDEKHGEQPYFEDYYGVGHYTPLAVGGVGGLQRTHMGLYAKWQGGTPRAPQLNTGNPLRNPPRHNRQFAIWKEWARVKGEIFNCSRKKIRHSVSFVCFYF